MKIRNAPKEFERSIYNVIEEFRDKLLAGEICEILCGVGTTLAYVKARRVHEENYVSQDLKDIIDLEIIRAKKYFGDA